MTIEDRMNVILINARLDKPDSGIFYFIEFKDEEFGNKAYEDMKKENKVLEFGKSYSGYYFFAEDADDFEKAITGWGFDNIKELSAQWDL